MPDEFTECNFSDTTDAGNPLHQHKDGTWWWYDETWSIEQGPYVDAREAYTELKRYCDEVLGS